MTKSFRSTCRLQDSLTDARVEIRVKQPDLEIIAVTGKFSRTSQKECLDTDNAFDKIIGVRIDSGMLKII